MSENKKMGTKILIKIIITIFGVIVFTFFLKGVWKGQLDIKETISRLAKKLVSEPDFLAKRDPNKIYQNGNEVGVVCCEVRENGDIITFEELNETERLNGNIYFEYKRYKLKTIQVETITGLKISTSSTNSISKKAVLSNVVCKKIK